MRAMSMCSAPVRQFLVAVPGRGGPEGEMRGESGAAREITLGREGRGRAASYYALPGGGVQAMWRSAPVRKFLVPARLA